MFGPLTRYQQEKKGGLARMGALKLFTRKKGSANTIWQETPLYTALCFMLKDTVNGKHMRA